jgi:oligopeptide/dipeptide ABC transporter ATP-binding protein
MSSAAETLLVVQGLHKHYRVQRGFLGRRRQTLRALDGVDLAVQAGDAMGLVGESGCGKSTLGRLILGLEKPSAGRVFFAGQDLAALDRAGMRALRRQMQIVFQDPVTSLNPRLTVGSMLAEPFVIHRQGSRGEIAAKVEALLNDVGLRPEHAQRYPHQFSGGQRQRIGIARALALRPRLMVADEPVSALDVSIQAQILNLLMDLKQKFGLTYLFVAHDLTVVRHLCDRVAVMYLGKIVEVAPTADIGLGRGHPYTEALLKAAPVANPALRFEAPPLFGDVPSPLNSPSGCRFHTRCPERQAVCESQEPPLRAVAGSRLCACHFL